jgi:para-aminobenzoate synthetase/4-amino-4-deoxychorismate lyase
LLSGLVTPRLDAGSDLLPGIMRAHVLQLGREYSGLGRVREAVVQRSDLARARRLWLINSVRGWVEVRMAGCACCGLGPLAM